MNVKDLIEALRERHPDDYVQVVACVGDAGYELRDLDVRQALEWDEDDEGIDNVPGVEIVCRVPARVEQDVTEEYLARLVEARQEYLRLIERIGTDIEDEWKVQRAVGPWARLVRLLAAELGIESRTTGILVPEEDNWPIPIKTSDDRIRRIRPERLA